MYVLEEESGQGLVEYALILVFVSIALVLVLTLLGSSLINAFNNLITELSKY